MSLCDKSSYKSQYQSQHDLLYTHFSIGGCYALLKRDISACKFVKIKKKCPICAKFPEDSDVVKCRKYFRVLDMQVFKNPNGKKLAAFAH